MKKLFLIVAVLVAFASSSFAQMEFGLKAGLNLNSGTNLEDPFESKMTPNFHIGVIADMPIAGDFALECGALFDSKGVKGKGEIPMYGYSCSETVKTNMYGLTIPVNAKYSFLDGKVYAVAGPNIGIMLFGKEKGEVEMAGNKETYDDSVEFGSDGYSRFFMGLNFGAGFNFTEKMGVALGYNLGLTGVVKDSESKFNTLSISFTYKF